MDYQNGKVEGPRRIEADLEFHGMITRGVTIAPGVHFILHGMVTGDLIAETTSRVIVHGMVNGLVRNEGAHVEIHGMIDDLYDPHEMTLLAPDSVIRSREGK